MNTDVVRLYLMQVAYLPPMNIPIVCYLVQTGDGKNILIDTGLSHKIPPPPGMEPVLEQDVIEQLAMIGLQPADIDMLICTHFDMDHSSNHAAFTQAEYIIQRYHYEMALHHPRFAATRSEWDQPLDRFRLVDSDMELLPGVELIETSGHVSGHQSVLVRLPETGAVLLTIDAVTHQNDFTTERQKGHMDEDEVALIASTRKLLDLVEKEEIPLVIFGHDPQQWQRLKKAPDFYC